MDRAEQRFIWLLRQRKYDFWPDDKLDEVIKVRQTKPDFYVRTPQNQRVLIEVESFEKPISFRSAPKQAMVRDIRPVLERIRRTVRRGARQLEPYEPEAIPMLVVVDNWRQVGIPTNVTDLWDALFRPLGRPLMNQGVRRWISGVAFNLPKRRTSPDAMTGERPMYLQIIHNPFAFVPFPKDVFKSKGDKHYRVNPKGRLVEVH